MASREFVVVVVVVVKFFYHYYFLSPSFFSVRTPDAESLKEDVTPAEDLQPSKPIKVSY